MTERQRPRFRGVKLYKDPLGRFSFRYPSDWNQFELDEGRDGVLLSPQADNPQTWFSVWTSPLEETAVADDLEELRVGVQEGLAQLTNSQIEYEADDAISNLLKFERIFTFEENGTTRKRKLWILYVAKWLIVVTWQGETVEEYHHWFAMGNYCFATFNLVEELWFATDRDLQGQLKQ